MQFVYKEYNMASVKEIRELFPILSTKLYGKDLVYFDNGAASVRAVATHAVLSGKAYENIEKSKLTEVIFTDSIPQKQPCSKIKVLPIAPMFADTIRNIYEHKSISDHFLM